MKCFFHHNLEYNFPEKTGVCKDCGQKSNFNVDTTDSWAGIPDSKPIDIMVDRLIEKIFTKDTFLKHHIKEISGATRWDVIVVFSTIFLISFIVLGLGWAIGILVFVMFGNGVVVE